VNIGGISRKRVAIYGAINFGAINLLLQKMEQFDGTIIWYHLMAPFYGMCVPGLCVCLSMCEGPVYIPAHRSEERLQQAQDVRGSA